MSEKPELIATRGNEAEIRVGGRTFIVPFIVRGTVVNFAFDGEIYSVDTSPRDPRRRGRHRDHSTEAPMPGTVLKILAKPGDVVKKGAPLIVLEAMKMEHTITAPRDGVVEALNCVEGELVQPGLELVTFKDEG